MDERGQTNEQQWTSNRTRMDVRRNGDECWIEQQQMLDGTMMDVRQNSDERRMNQQWTLEKIT